MLPQLFERRGTTLSAVVSDALDYFRRCQLPDGSIAEDPEIRVFQEWDSVNALKAIALWPESEWSQRSEAVAGITDFLRSREKSNGMLSWGILETGPAEYCTETSSEYITALTLLGHTGEARSKAEFLRARQLPSGPWEEVHQHIPRAFQTEPSVTGFAALALLGLDIDPLYSDEMLDFLAGRQKNQGHFGINWYYYSTYYYLMRPAVATLAAFENYPAVMAARDFVLSQQRDDGSWYSEVAGFGAYSSPEQHTAMALRTLAHAGLDATDSAVQRAVSWLIGRVRADGSWNGGPYPYPETDSYRHFRATQHVFTTAQVLSALKLLEELETS